ncbi:MAG: hybrid sensor histidine kinase/response regulator [Deltaproteobacteria bacterium]|nr:hybrid sensor histidine kinase/response regulator [Deltaproteobacteria bacterium]
MKDRVLVVDDSPQNRMVAVGHLEAAGYEVVAASSGEEALAYVRANRVDLVVLDVLMPGMGGFEVCKRLRAIPALSDLPVMFMTALGDREATQPALDAGADDLLPKPFQRAELLLRVRALIRQRRQAVELAAQNDQLRKLEQDKRRMQQLIVHDLKGPATALYANAELLRARSLPGDTPEIVEDIMVAVGNLDRTVRNLLDLSRAEDVGLSVQVEPLDITAMTAEVITSLRGLGKLHDVTIVSSIQTNTLMADRELIRRMLQNLVHNAIKHSPGDSEVVIEATRDAHSVMFRVSDQGPGVPDGDDDKIFEAYVTRDRPNGGHGLGLVFCRLAAEAHRGRIWVERGQPSGATFCVHLPQS